MKLLKLVESLINMYEKSQRAEFYKNKTAEIKRREAYFNDRAKEKEPHRN